MAQMIELSMVKSGWEAVRSVFQYVWKWAHPPKIGYRLTPPNLLEVVRPYAYRGKVLEQLGEPHHVWKREASYRFSDALLQVRYDEDDTIDSVTLVALSMRWPHRFHVHPLKFRLARDKFSDTSGSDPIEMRRDWSSKFMTYWKTEYYGFPGNYNYFSFALISAATWPPLSWPKQPKIVQSGDEIWTLDNPRIKFNAVAICRDKPEVFPFTWSSFQ